MKKVDRLLFMDDLLLLGSASMLGLKNEVPCQDTK